MAAPRTRPARKRKTKEDRDIEWLTAETVRLLGQLRERDETIAQLRQEIGSYRSVMR